MTNKKVKEQKIENLPKLPKYKEIYYKIMILLLDYLTCNFGGQGIVLGSVILFYTIIFAIIVLPLGIDRPENKWGIFCLIIFLSLLGVYHWFFVLRRQIKNLANKYRKRIGVEPVEYSNF